MLKEDTNCDDLHAISQAHMYTSVAFEPKKDFIFNQVSEKRILQSERVNAIE